MMCNNGKLKIKKFVGLDLRGRVEFYLDLGFQNYDPKIIAHYL